MILLTGASGFLGKTFLECTANGTVVTTIGRNPKSDDPNYLQCDLSKDVPLLDSTSYFDTVVHFAGKAHSIPKTEEEKLVFWKTNFEGTKNLLKALDSLDKKPRLFVTSSTVAVYGLYSGVNISEDTSPKPDTPYGESKLEAEKAIKNWCEKNEVEYLILRLPLIAGKNPPGNLGMMKTAISKGRYPRIGKNSAKKSMVLAEDISNLILNHKNGSGVFNLTDGYHPSFYEIEQAVEKRVGKKISINIPLMVLKPFALVGDLIESISNKQMPLSSGRLSKLTDSLTFDDSKAREALGWNPRHVLPFIEKYL